MSPGDGGICLSLPAGPRLSDFVTHREGKEKEKEPGVVVHTFNPSTWEVEAGGFLSLRTAWSTKWFQDSQGYTEKPCLKKPKKKKKKRRLGNVITAKLL